MKKHLENIIDDIDVIIGSDNYIKNSASQIKSITQEFISSIGEDDDVLKIDYKKLKTLSNLVYDLNYANTFSTLTDHISNELYAFEFLLQEKLLKKERE